MSMEARSLLVVDDPISDPREEWSFERKPREETFSLLLRVERNVAAKASELPEHPQRPEQLIERYVRLALGRALVQDLEDGTWYGEAPLLRGVWVDGNSEEEVEARLPDAIRSWVLAKIADADRDIPPIESVDLNRI